MKFQESIADYVTCWKAGKAREELVQHEQRKKQEPKGENRYDEEPRSQRQAQDTATSKELRPEALR
jgi:ribosomal protein S30